MNINSKDIGEDYAKILQEVIEIRKKRRSLYGDTYVEMPSSGQFWHCFNKIKRLRYNIEKINQNSSKKYESAKDNALDVINYMIFFLIMLEKEKTK